MANPILIAGRAVTEAATPGISTTDTGRTTDDDSSSTTDNESTTNSRGSTRRSS